jgi:hypothetical protein
MIVFADKVNAAVKELLSATLQIRVNTVTIFLSEALKDMIDEINESINFLFLQQYVEVS